MNKRGNLVVISGPSGVGKTTICSEIIARRKDTVYSISATSRPKRRGEKNGREYFFLTEDEFKRWLQEGRFVEYAIVHGNYYGTPKKFLEDNLNKGNNVLLDIDIQGTKKLMELYSEGIYIFLLPPNFEELKKRLLKRKTDKKREIEKRLKIALKEMKYAKDYKYVVRNDCLEETVDEIMKIIDRETGGKKEN